MELNLNDFKNKELIVRKRIASFLKKLLVFMNNEFSYETYKQIIYNEISCISKLDFKIKSYYDGIWYLINNAKTPLTQKILSNFLNIINLNIVDNSLLIKITSKLFELENFPILNKCISFHVFIYNYLSEFTEEQRLIVSLTFFNYLLVKNNIPCIDISVPNLHNYIKCRDEYIKGDKENLYVFIFNTIKEAKFQDKEYYQNLKYLTIQDIKKQIVKDKDEIKKKYKIQKLMMFGSFVQENQRIDSDIDMIVIFEDDITSKEKRKNILDFSNYYFSIFNRFIDLQEIGSLLTDEMLITFNKIEILF